MSRQPSLDPARAVLPMAQWPGPDRLSWEQAKSKAIAAGPFRKHGGGFRRSPDTILKSERGIGRWLGFLQRTGRLGERKLPAERLTLEHLDAYFEHLIGCGNSNRSVVGRFEELRLAFEIMSPRQDFSWITAPQGTPLKHLLPHEPQPRFVPDSVEALAWAEELFETGLLLTSRYYRCIQVRDALIIAVLVTRAPRLRALTSLRVGTHFYRDGSDWILNQRAPITKCRNEIVLPLPSEVGTMADRYLAVERPEMLQGTPSDMLWIAQGGRPLSRSSLVAQIRSKALKRFGVEFGPHRFRTGLTTTLALRNPNAPFDASLILGHSPAVSLADYNRATAVAASRRRHSHIQDLRQATEDLARHAFGTSNLASKTQLPSSNPGKTSVQHGRK